MRVTAGGVSIGKKLVLSTLCTLLVIVLIGIVTFLRFAAIGDTLDEMVFRAGVQRQVLSMNARLADIHARSYQAITWSSSGFAEARIAKQAKAIMADLDAEKEAVARVKGMVRTSGEQAALQEAADILEKYAKEVAGSVDMALADAGAASMMMQSADAVFTGLEEKIEALVSLEEGLARSANDLADAAMRTALYLIGILFSLAIAVGLGLNLAVARSITGPIRRIIGYAGMVAGGNITAHPEGEFSAEMAEMRTSIETMVENLKAKMAEAEEKSAEARRQADNASQAMREATVEKERGAGLLRVIAGVAEQATEISASLASAAEELSQQTEEINRGAEVQRNRVQETATAMEEMNATVLEVSRNATEAAGGAESAQQMAHEGARIVGEAMKVTGAVQQQAEGMAASLGELGRRAEAIGRIMDVINDIADQTNLLALNAAIEAARAGDAGRGFAVVADEVRKLAEKTMTATKEVGDAIQGIQEGTRVNIQAMQGASQAVSQNTELTKKAGSALSEIVGIVVRTADQVRAIATAAEEQSSASEQIARSTSEVHRIAIETSHNITQSVQAIHEVASLAAQLERLIAELGECSEKGERCV